MPRTPSDHTARAAGGVLFAVLLAIGIVQTRSEPLTVATAIVVGLWYLLSLRIEDRNPRHATLWLVTLLLGWATLIVLSAAFVWLAFILAILTWHFLPRHTALPTTIAITVGTITSLAWHENHLNAGAVIGPAIGIATAVAVTEVYHQIRKQSDELLRMQKELTQREHEAGQAYERERLGRELHDTVAQNLTSITMLLRAAHADIPPKTETHRLLDVALDTTQDALTQTRNFIRGYSTTDNSTLPEAILSTVERARQMGLAVTVKQQNWDQTLPIAHKVALLRVAQEALANTIRHANAKHAHVQLEITKTSANISISDDGHGFDPTAPQTPRTDGTGYGLRGLTARVQEHGGTLTITSKPGEGTTVTAHIPIGAP